MVALRKTSASARSRISKSALLAGAALAVPFAAHAGPISISQTVTTTDRTTPASLDLDLLGDGNVEFTITADLGGDQITITPGSNASYVGTTIIGFGFAQPFDDPSQITLAQPFINNPGGKIQKLISGSMIGPWPQDGSFAYLGIQFMDNGTNYLGWIHLSATVFDPSNTTVPSLFAQTSAAIQPNATFTIDGASVDVVTPEPASIALFALGAAGLAALRARRKRVQ